MADKMYQKMVSLPFDQYNKFKRDLEREHLLMRQPEVTSAIRATEAKEQLLNDPNIPSSQKLLTLGELTQYLDLWTNKMRNYAAPSMPQQQMSSAANTRNYTTGLIDAATLKDVGSLTGKARARVLDFLASQPEINFDPSGQLVLGGEAITGSNRRDILDFVGGDWSKKYSNNLPTGGEELLQTMKTGKTTLARGDVGRGFYSLLHPTGQTAATQVAPLQTSNISQSTPFSTPQNNPHHLENTPKIVVGRGSVIRPKTSSNKLVGWSPIHPTHIGVGRGSVKKQRRSYSAPKKLDFTALEERYIH